MSKPIHLGKYTAALEPGQRAVYLAEELKDYDLLGQALVELGMVQARLPGMEWQAVHTQRRYFEFVESYKQPAKRYYLTAMYNLAYYLRAVGKHGDALEQFLKAYEAAKARQEHAVADRCRRAAVARALHLKKLDLAEQLVEQGKAYINGHTKDDRANASHLIDEAQTLYLKGDLTEAAATAAEAAIRAKAIPELCSSAFDLLHKIGKATELVEGALAAAFVAKIQAEKDERYDLANQLRSSIKELAVRYPEAVERFMRDITKPA